MLTNSPNTKNQQNFDGSTSDIPRLLVMRLGNVGDVVTLGPALRALREKFPNTEITLMASPTGSQVATMLPWVDRVLIHETLWQENSKQNLINLGREMEFIERLKALQFTMAVIFTSFSQSPFPLAYACYLAGIPYRIGFSKEFGGRILTHSSLPPADDISQVDRNLKLLETIGIYEPDNHLELHVPEGVRQNASALLYSAHVNLEMPYIVLAPGTAHSARRYDPFRLAAATHILAGQTELPIVIVGTSQDMKNMEPILQMAEENLYGNLHSLVGKTSVPELAAIIRQASLTIAHNSAPMHIADTFKRPMLILYSGTDLVSQWMPRQAPTRLLCRPVYCSPCYKFDCPFNMECLNIRPSEVAIAALEMLDEHVFNRFAVRRLGVTV